MGLNLGISLDEFKKKYEEFYIKHKGKCLHENSQYKKGWILLTTDTYAPAAAAGRFLGKNKIAKRIVKNLETKGIYELKNENCKKDTLVSALQEITLIRSTLNDVFNLIYDYGYNGLMLDRKAYGTNGALNKFCMQWYIHK